MKSICVFCGSSKGESSKFIEAAGRMAALLTKQGLTLIYGGGSVGLMGILADEVLARKGRVIGVIPRKLFAKELAHAGLTELHEVDSMHERKQLMYDLSDGFVALPGGLGTLEELCEILTWAQLGIHRKPCGLLNVAGFYDDLIRFLDHATGSRFLRREHRELLLVDSSPQALLGKMEAFQPPALPKWIDEDEA